jgi:hypothetical protein
MVEAPDTREVRISNALMLILRNKAIIRRLRVASDGYVLAEDVLELPSLARHGASISDIQKITFESKQQQFQLRQGLDGNGGPIYIREEEKNVPGLLRSDAENRSLLLPPGWHCEPRTPAYCPACVPWMEKKSDTVSSEASALPASCAIWCSRHSWVGCSLHRSTGAGSCGPRELLHPFAPSGELVSDLVQSDAEERSQLFPIACCEPLTSASSDVCFPLIEKKSEAGDARQQRFSLQSLD